MNQCGQNTGKYPAAAMEEATVNVAEKNRKRCQLMDGAQTLAEGKLAARAAEAVVEERFFCSAQVWERVWDVERNKRRG